MIRKVPNMSAWVMHYKDYRNWVGTSTIHLGFQLLIPLPLFELSPKVYALHFLIEEDELILVVDAYMHHKPYTLEQVEEINKTWNKFYEESTRK